MWKFLPIEDIEKAVLVTGGAGFIGSRLVFALLEKGIKVKVLDTQYGPFEKKKHANLEFIGVGSDYQHGGMVDKGIVEQAVKDVDVVYHLAINWNGYTWRHTLPLADLFDINIKGTLNLLETARSQGVRHFLFSSSCAVYGESESPTVDEEDVCKPELWEGDPGRAYGIVKFTTERLCLLYHQQYGLPVSVFRIDVVFDEEQALPSRKILDNVLSGEVIEVVEGDGYASIHVDEVVDAFLLATLNENVYGEVFNLSNPAAYISYRELYQLLIQLTNSKSKVRLVKEPTCLTKPKRSLYLLDTKKIQKALGWKPKKTKEDLKKAIAQGIKP